MVKEMARYFGEPSDVVSSDPSKKAGSLIAPPTGWPKSFSENATLKALMGKKQLGGTRCRLTGPPSAEDASKAAAIELAHDDSFGNAEKVQQALGWQVIKGFTIFELKDSNGTVFIGHKRWWNQKDTGIWVDYTPRPEGITEMVLLESAKSTKEKVEPSDAVEAAAAEREALGGFASAPKAAPKAAAATKPAKPKPKAAPPSPPPKLEYKGSESLDEMVKVLSRGTKDAQAKAAAAIAAQAATGPEESKRIVAAGGLQPLLLLLRQTGDAQDHAARAIMSLADCMEHQQLITRAGTIPAVIQLLKSAPAAVQARHAASACRRAAAAHPPHAALQETAAGILGNLAIQNPANQAAAVAAGALPPLVDLLLKGSTPAKEQTCFALWNLACQNSETQVAIEQAGAIKPLTSLLSKGGASLQEEAAGALMNLAAHPENKRAIAACGAVDALVAMLKSGGGAAEQAAGCLMNLASNNSENQRAIMKANALPPLLAMLKDKANCSRRAREYVAGALMNLTLRQPTVQADVAKAGAIPLLVHMLLEGEGAMEEVAGALTNLADSNEDNQAAIAAAGAVPPLVKLLSSKQPSEQEEAAGTIMNLAACEANKKKIGAAGAVKPLVGLLQRGSDAAKEHAAGALANLANEKEELQAAIGAEGAIAPLLALLESDGAAAEAAGAADGTGRGGVRARAASALLLLSLRKENGEAIRKAGGVQKLVAALSKGVAEAAGALMNLALQSAETQAAIVADGAVPPLVAMVCSGSPTAQEEAAGAIMNLVSGSSAHQAAVAEAGAILPLAMLLSWGTQAAKEQAAAALANLAKGNKANRADILAAQVVPALLQIIQADEKVKEKEKGAKPVAKVAGSKTTAGGKTEAANCLCCLIEGDTMLQAELVQDGALKPIAALLRDRTTKEAAARLLGAFDSCFEDAVEAAKA